MEIWEILGVMVCPKCGRKWMNMVLVGQSWSKCFSCFSDSNLILRHHVEKWINIFRICTFCCYYERPAVNNLHNRDKTLNVTFHTIFRNLGLLTRAAAIHIFVSKHWSSQKSSSRRYRYISSKRTPLACRVPVLLYNGNWIDLTQLSGGANFISLPQSLAGSYARKKR